MKIQTITATGLKSGDFSHDLSPVTIFTGANFAGKTSRLEAVRLALIGYLPELGHRPSDTMKLSRNGSLEVGITTDLGTLSRTWLKGKEPITTGDLPATPPVLMDPSEYFSLGPKDRMRYVFSRCSLDNDKGGAEIVKLITYLGVPGEEAAKASTALAREIDADDTNRHNEGMPVQDWLAQIIASLRDRFKASKAVVNTLTKSGNAQVMLADGTATADRTAEITALQMKRDGINGRLGEIHGELAGLMNTINRMGALQIELKRLSNLPAMPQAELDRLQALSNAETGIESARLRLAEAERSASLAGGKYFAAKESQVAMLKERDTALAATCCPHCGAKGKGWKKTIEETWSIKLLDGDNKMSHLGDLFQDASLLRDRAQTKVQEAEAAEKERLAAQQKLIFALSTNQAVAKRDGIAKQLADLGNLEAIRKQQADLGKEQHVLNTAANAIAESLAKLTVQQRQFIEAARDRQTRAKALLQRKVAEVECTVLAAAVKALEKHQAAMVDQAFAAILDKANLICQGMLRTPLAYSDGQLGRFEGETWIGHETFSGLERALCFAGISYALAANAPCRIILMDELGRMDGKHLRVFVTRMAELVDGGVIDQCICAGTLGQSARAALPTDITVIEL